MPKIDLKEIKSLFPSMMNHQYIELIRELRKKPPADYVPFQLCPKCSGEGDIAITTARVTCDVCGGKKIIPMHPIKKKEEKDDH